MAAPRYDVGLDEDGDLPVRVQHVTGFALICQRLTRRLRTFKGEYFADTRVGLPFFDWFAMSPPRVAEIGALVRREIETTPGVIRVDDFTGSYDADTATLSYGGTVRTIDGIADIRILPIGPTPGNRQPSVRLLVTSSRIAP